MCNDVWQATHASDMLLRSPCDVSRPPACTSHSNHALQLAQDVPATLLAVRKPCHVSAWESGGLPYDPGPAGSALPNAAAEFKGCPTAASGHALEQRLGLAHRPRPFAAAQPQHRGMPWNRGLDLRMRCRIGGGPTTAPRTACFSPWQPVSRASLPPTPNQEIPSLPCRSPL